MNPLVMQCLEQEYNNKSRIPYLIGKIRKDKDKAQNVIKWSF